MKLLEHEGKEILKARGVAVPPAGGVITKPAQLAAAMKRAGKGPWVLKAQVLAGGRGKAGGIKLAKTPAEAKELVKKMLGMDLVTHQTHGQAIKVKELFVEGGVKIERELYFSVVMDRKSAGPVIIASAQGGMEIETALKPFGQVAVAGQDKAFHMPLPLSQDGPNFLHECFDLDRL